MKFSFGTCAAQAAEIMCAVLQGTLVQWVDTRGPGALRSRKEFDFQFCGLENSPDEFAKEKRAHRDLLKQRLKGFGESLSGYVIDSLELQYEDSMVDNVRFARFILKHRSKSQVVIHLHFERGSEGASTVWGPWHLHAEKAIECKLHPDERFHGETILWQWS